MNYSSSYPSSFLDYSDYSPPDTFTMDWNNSDVKPKRDESSFGYYGNAPFSQSQPIDISSSNRSMQSSPTMIFSPPDESPGYSQNPLGTSVPSECSLLESFPPLEPLASSLSPSTESRFLDHELEGMQPGSFGEDTLFTDFEQDDAFRYYPSSLPADVGTGLSMRLPSITLQTSPATKPQPIPAAGKSRRPRNRSIESSGSLDLSADLRPGSRRAMSVTKLAGQKQSWKVGQSKPRGVRTQSLEAPKRTKVAGVRQHGACEQCKAKRVECDVGLHCEKCVKKHHRKEIDLFKSPCRQNIIKSAVDQLFHPDVIWHPRPRSMETCFGEGAQTLPTTLQVPLKLGFASAMMVQVRPIKPKDPFHFTHHHSTQPWPPKTSPHNGASVYINNVHTVFPAEFDLQSVDLKKDLAFHLLYIVDKEFIKLPRWESPLKLLNPIHRFYEHCRSDASTRSAEASHLADDGPVVQAPSVALQFALMLLTLVHVSGDATVDTNDANVQRILSLAPEYKTNMSISACYMRSQLGGVMPDMARDILSLILEQIMNMSLQQHSQDFAIVLAIDLVLCMVMETIQYHASRTPYHVFLPGGQGMTQESMRTETAAGEKSKLAGVRGGEKTFEQIRRFFKTCYSKQMADCFGAGSSLANFAAVNRLDPVSQQFLEEMRSEVLKNQDYMQMIGNKDVERTQDVTVFFDRLLSKFFIASP